VAYAEDYGFFAFRLGARLEVGSWKWGRICCQEFFFAVRVDISEVSRSKEGADLCSICIGVEIRIGVER
jgi:hypothetical protein